VSKQVVKVIWHKAASPPHMDGSVVFFRWRRCAPRPTRASFGHRESMSQTASRSVQLLCTCSLLSAYQQPMYTNHRNFSYVSGPCWGYFFVSSNGWIYPWRHPETSRRKPWSAFVAI